MHIVNTPVATGVMATCAVGDLLARGEQRAVVAQVLMTGRAAVATSARGDESEHDMIARSEPTHVGTDGLNNAGALVSTDQR
jgi:hypothetical protein